MAESNTLSTSQIKDWRSILTLVVFVFTNVIVLRPFSIHIYVPQILCNLLLDASAALRITSRSRVRSQNDGKLFQKITLPINLVTAPLIADLFLLTISAIGLTEIHDGTLGANHIFPIDIMVFFITLAYIAVSIDASGLIRWLAFKVLQKGKESGHLLFLYLYFFFFILGSLVGNDPIVLSGTAFLAYLTRASSNIVYPKAWIHSQFAVANIASTILVSSNPTNLVLAGAFEIKFVDYTLNMIVPVVATAVLLFPFLLYSIFKDKGLIPRSIEIHTLPDTMREKKPVNPNIPNARGAVEDKPNDAEANLLQLEEIMNPYLDKWGAGFGTLIMVTTLTTLLVLNATSPKGGHPVYWVTLPAAFVMLCWDLASGWYHRTETRQIARQGKESVDAARYIGSENIQRNEFKLDDNAANQNYKAEQLFNSTGGRPTTCNPTLLNHGIVTLSLAHLHGSTGLLGAEMIEMNEEGKPSSQFIKPDTFYIKQQHQRTTIASLIADAYRWSHETFPTVTTVVAHLPFALVPFAFCMFILVQGLVTNGWVPVFAYGWNHWVERTGTIGAVGGMGFLSVVLCNFSGTNIGTAILLSRVVQAWQEIRMASGGVITERTFWATVYSMAIGVNFGAFSTAFSASLAGLLWRDILARKHIFVRGVDFAKVNSPIITVAMLIACTVLVGELYLTRTNAPYHP